jgi:hypothetical protein
MYFFGLLLFVKKVPLLKDAKGERPFAFPAVGPLWSSRTDADRPSTHVQRTDDGLSKEMLRGRYKET